MDKVIDILDALANEKGLRFDDVVEAFKKALAHTSKKILGDVNIEIDFNKETKTLNIHQIAEVVADNDDRAYEDEENFIYLDEAHDINENLQIGDKVKFELDFEKLGRSGAAILQKDIDFQILRLLEQNIYKKYVEKIGQLITGTIVKIDKDENTYIEIGEVKGVLPKRNRIKGEKFKVGDTLKAVLKYINMDKSHGITIELSRTTPQFLIELIKLAVPEAKDELIQIYAAARIPGVRAKIAVSSLTPNVDPIGTVIGTKGVRINSVSKELNNENIDVIEYSDKPEMFISRALSPAIIESVKIEEVDDEEEQDIAHVTLLADQKAKAIGKNGINVTLANMLTRYKIELVEKDSSETKSKDTSALDNLFSI